MENTFTTMHWVGGATTTSFTKATRLWKLPPIAAGNNDTDYDSDTT